MTIAVTAEQLKALAPKAQQCYADAFRDDQVALQRHGISGSAQRLAHFMAQVLHESAALTTKFENLNYRAERLPVVWPSRFKPKGPLDALDYANNGEKLANVIYAGRMGNDGAGDGFTYRGRGLLQVTGKSNYRAVTATLRRFDPNAPDLVALPDIVLDTAWCLGIAAVVWETNGCNAMADRDDIAAITRAINGGLLGLDERSAWVLRTKAIWCP